MKYTLLVREFGTKETGSWRSLRPAIDLEKCTTCGRCVEFCPDGVIDFLENGKGVVVDLRFCKGCGICSEVCTVRVIQMIEEP